MNGDERSAPRDFDSDTAPDLSVAGWQEKFARARVRRGRPPVATPNVSTTIRLSPDALAHFKAGGRGWQTRITRRYASGFGTRTPRDRHAHGSGAAGCRVATRVEPAPELTLHPLSDAQWLD